MTTTNFNLILVHPGEFHADETCAIATIYVLTGKRIPVQRRPPTPEELMDPAVLVLDQLRNLDWEIGAVDHHQDPSLPATNVLVLEKFFEGDERVKQKIMKSLFMPISDVDCGNATGGPGHINGLIRSLNQMPDGFNTAIVILERLIEAAIQTAKNAVEHESVWESLEKDKFGIFRVSDHPTPILGWKELAEKEGIIFYVHPARGGYGITSRNTELFKIPADSRQTFLHASQFTAVYAERAHALAHAQELAENIFEQVLKRY
jgi:hypothetical protein